MRVLTPERTMRSLVLYAAGVDEVDTIDMQLGADEGFIINAVEGSIVLDPDIEDGVEICRQYLRLDPDAAATDLGVLTDSTAIDTDILFEHVFGLLTGIDDGAGGGLGYTKTDNMLRDFRGLAVPDRPKSISNLSHVVDAGDATGISLIIVRYQLVQFSMAELGILNAYRRF